MDPLFDFPKETRSIETSPSGPSTHVSLGGGPLT